MFTDLPNGVGKKERVDDSDRGSVCVGERERERDTYVYRERDTGIEREIQG